MDEDNVSCIDEKWKKVCDHFDEETDCPKCFILGICPDDPKYDGEEDILHENH